MANHVHNKLTIVGPSSEVDVFVTRAHAMPTHDGPTTPLQFHALVPARDSSYAAEREAWGVKWGAFADRLVEHRSGIDRATATYFFDTAWNPPDEFLKRVSQLFPAVLFLLSYAGEGPIRGRWVIQNGVIDYYAADNDAPTYGAAGSDVYIDDEDARVAAFDKWADFYHSSHETWISDAELVVQIQASLKSSPEKELTTRP